jgi:hypothetical protein
MAQFIIDHGSDIKSRDEKGWILLHAASQFGHVDVAWRGHLKGDVYHHQYQKRKKLATKRLEDAGARGDLGGAEELDVEGPSWDGFLIDDDHDHDETMYYSE